MASRTAWSRLAMQPLSTLAQRGTAPAAASFSSLSSSALRRLARRPSPAPVPLASSPAGTFVRLAHNIPRPKAAAPADPLSEASTPSSPAPQRGSVAGSGKNPNKIGLAPHYELTFTCLPCGTRSAHHVSKQGYHHGSVLITCPSCRNRHIISDHLGIFGNVTKEGGSGGGRTIEDILREKGQLVKKGTLGEDGDVEFWEDGTTSERQTRLAAEDVMLPQSNEKKDKDKRADKEAAPGSTFTSAGKA
ncbi:hypothetical protein HMPREF1624_04165 [Sporothrix schenckii ATCC 58251]|uniref:DNL-type domain-containing protein n=1 Tax=Sporothrix schenckii (strain ATCC 58251 / de Perez 2211183) TaxID=1391915 RepID=U7PWY7_SPOS1|nr:hypothetical protein HMPREF1624_04165 [Sporothrix schenckii ATCC 58251]